MSAIVKQLELKHGDERVSISTIGFQLIHNSKVLALTCVHGAVAQFAREQNIPSSSVYGRILSLFPTLLEENGDPILDVYNEDVDFMLLRSDEKETAVFDMEKILAVTMDSVIDKLDKEGEESMKVWLDCPGGLVKCRVLRPRIRDYSNEYSSVKYNPLTHIWIKYPATLEIKKGYGGSAVLTEDFLPMGMLRAVTSRFNAALCILIKPILERVMVNHPQVQVVNTWKHSEYNAFNYPHFS